MILVSRQIDDIAEDVEQQLFGKLRDKLFSIQLDEATDSNKDAHFIAYVRFWDASYEWVKDPFQNTPEGLSTTEEEIFIDFTSSGEIKRQFCNKTHFQFWAEVDDEFSELKTKSFRILLPFSTSYLCETGFSAVAALKTKYRSQLNIEKELRVSISNIKPSFENLCSELWFQQVGATCHTARATIDLLKDTLGDRLISRFGTVNWPPRSCDLTPLEYFLWSYVKSLVYADKSQTLDHLEDSIRRVIADIRPKILEKVIENWMSRLDYIRASCGSHMPEIMFKIYTRAFGDRHCNLESWSSDEDATCADTSLLVTTTPAGGRLSSQQIRTHDIPATSLLP
ncbi:zinc finger BED domain-containing protein 5 [Trichonephila clavipes]|nr:zinc finger BED domain-containing protein 5 [Trichonephila clavipes]